MLRNTVRVGLSRALAFSQAAYQRKQLFVWKAHDTTPKGAKLDTEFQDILDQLHPKKTADLNGLSYFFEGIHYVLVDSDNPSAGRVKNNLAIGKALLLDPREPAPSNPAAGVRKLRYPPRAVFVQPDHSDLGRVCHSVCPACPPGCMPISLKSATFHVSLPAPITLKKDGTPP